MFWLPIIAAAAGGAALAKRQSPTATAKRMKAIGPVSGLSYDVDDLVNQGLVIVHFQGTSGTFRRLDPMGFEFIDGRGNRDVLGAMICDFAPPPEEKGNAEPQPAG